MLLVQVASLYVFCLMTFWCRMSKAPAWKHDLLLQREGTRMHVSRFMRLFEGKVKETSVFWRDVKSKRAT